MNRDNKAQSLLEFSLVAPLLIMILVVISELGYSFVVNHTINDAIKLSIQSSNFMVGKYTTQAELLKAMKGDLEEYIKKNNLPPAVDIQYGMGQSNAYGTLVVVKYTYKPNFRIVGITPETVTLESSQVVPPSLLKVNNPTAEIIPGF